MTLGLFSGPDDSVRRFARTTRAVTGAAIRRASRDTYLIESVGCNGKSRLNPLSGHDCTGVACGTSGSLWIGQNDGGTLRKVVRVNSRSGSVSTPSMVSCESRVAGPALAPTGLTQYFVDSAGNKYSSAGVWLSKFSTNTPTIARQFRIPTWHELPATAPSENARIIRLADDVSWEVSDLAAGTGYACMVVPKALDQTVLGSSNHGGFDTQLPYDLAVRGSALRGQSDLVVSMGCRVAGALGTGGCGATSVPFDGWYVVVRSETAGMAVLGAAEITPLSPAVCAEDAGVGGATNADGSHPSFVQFTNHFHFAPDHVTGGWWRFVLPNDFSNRIIVLAQRVTYAAGVVTLGTPIVFDDPTESSDVNRECPVSTRNGEMAALCHAVYE